MSAYRLGSLFSGIGGLELGFEMTGEFETVFQVERDPWAQRVLAKHWPLVPRFDDVCTVHAGNLPACDVLVGGFPCQDLSLAGKGAGLEGDRSGLWWEFHRLIGELRPRLVVVENVPGLLLPRRLDRVLGSLAEIGFDAEWEVVSAASQGAPHIRERVFIVAYPGRGLGGGREGSQPGHDLAGEHGLHLNRAQAADQPQRPGADVAYPEGERGRPGLRVRGTEGLGERGVAGYARPAGREELLADSERVGRGASGPREAQAGAAVAPRHGREPVARNPWLAEPDVGRVADGVPSRVDRLRGLGNAVVPQVAYFVARRVLESGLLQPELSEVAA